MPYKDPTKMAAMQRLKWDLWNEYRDGQALQGICQHCELPILGLNPDRWSNNTDRWYHFVDPVALGLRPFGKNDPIYDLVRSCLTALEHRYLPEGMFDVRAGAQNELQLLVSELIAKHAITSKDMATP